MNSLVPKPVLKFCIKLHRHKPLCFHANRHARLGCWPELNGIVFNYLKWLMCHCLRQTCTSRPNLLHLLGINCWIWGTNRIQMKRFILLIAFNSNSVFCTCCSFWDCGIKGGKKFKGEFEMKTSEECKDKNRSGVRQQGEGEVQGNNRLF